MAKNIKTAINDHLKTIAELKKKLKQQADKENLLLGAVVRDYAKNNYEFAQEVLMAIEDAPARTKKALSGLVDELNTVSKTQVKAEEQTTNF
ncbi:MULTISPECIES: hypothetical protein [unclassified Moraxella]|uniref:hypothetical protein n=1 Tax=unclassified Moraxella TaxID=2685852 RepID=UPI002B40106B|nr:MULTISPECIES: hypothetical protein [unclassified Moraxella]